MKMAAPSLRRQAMRVKTGVKVGPIIKNGGGTSP
jgi:hypothetical protein